MSDGQGMAVPRLLAIATLAIALGSACATTSEKGNGAPGPRPGPSTVEPSSSAAPAPGAPLARQYVVTTVKAPVRIAPDGSRSPLAVLEPGARMLVLAREGDWYRVEFDDPRWGHRVGYVLIAHVEDVTR